uniref:Uncharacterized protein n=1 Tax=Pseudomonas phage HRDY3 TaxID=3236930 RepID=A0AB39CEF6_9VIRU
MIYLYFAVAFAALCFWQFRLKDWSATGIAAIVGFVAVLACYYVPLYWTASDEEILSGSVMKKERVYDPYTETYTCGTDSHGNPKTCTRLVDQWRWDVISDYGDSFSEHTSQKVRAPAIYAATQLGDPYASTKKFMNYQNVSEQSVMIDRESAKEYRGWVPEYPHIYAGFKVSRGFSNTPFMDQRGLSHFLSVAQKRWGPMHGVNVSVVVLDHRTDWNGFTNALASKWKGGKKNDAVLVLGLDEKGATIHAWAFSRSADEKTDERGRNFTKALYENAHDALMEKRGPIDVNTIIDSIDKSLVLFQREDLGRYDFLKDEYVPGWPAMILSFIIICAIVSITVKQSCDYLDRNGGYRRMYRRRGLM